MIQSRLCPRLSTLLSATLSVLTLQIASANAEGFGATPVSAFRAPEGFVVQKVYEVPSADQGSWVCMTQDLKGRLITSDQYGKLYRVTPAKPGESDDKTQVEILDVSVGMAQGLLHTQDGLYVDVNGASGPKGAGVYRLQDKDGDDRFETIDYLIPLNAGGEHGPHAIIAGPDGRLYICAGNSTDVPSNVNVSRVPRHWSEDLLLGRMPDARGFMVDRLAPGGFVLSCKPDGSDIELFATGFRNEYDLAFNKDNELFTFDSDMEWDIGTPWYVPTRVNHVTSGAEFGWRNGTGRWPDYFADSLGSVANIGYGSPTGIVFPYNAKFPNKYAESLLIGDWSYGVIYAVHLTPHGSTYTSTVEPFLSAAPLPVTDMVVDTINGGLYVSIGGRKVQSAIYRVSYMGSDTTPAQTDVFETAAASRAIRKRLETFHLKSPSATDLTFINDHLGSEDRPIRFAARIALEHTDLATARTALADAKRPLETITAAIAVARLQTEGGSKEDQQAIQKALLKIDWDKCDDVQRIELIRAYQLVFTRFNTSQDDAVGSPNAKAIVKQLDNFPVVGSDNSINRELARLLVFLKAPGIVDRCVHQMQTAGGTDDQIHYAFCLREQTTGWTEENRRNYFKWFYDVASARGGESFGGFIENIRQVAIKRLDDSEKAKLSELVGAPPAQKDVMAELAPRNLVSEWKLDDLLPGIEAKKSGFNYERGKQMFAVAQCYKCHRFAGQGGNQGPDLTASSGRFGLREMLVAIIEPSKEISDQYQATQFIMDDDKIISGRVANLNGDTLMVATNMLDPSRFTNIHRKDIVETRPSTVSPMPSGLINTLTPDEVSDLLAYLRSGGNSKSPIYMQKTAAR